MNEPGLWVWIHVGMQQAINLHQVSAIVFEEGEPLVAHLYLPVLETSAEGQVQARRVRVEGAEAEGLRAYLGRTARHLDDLGAG